ncbi:hypothetical protein MLD38_024136 [Melastoma candidum]|uniref:Uncharacterized protein n=1 Tax=Melastoma candidum TaxID=119954 RepID=A0ACB9NU11_9MYRT|nr:hypothetical protein MLD38_024136 [Melastoma candidum]
MGSTCRDRTSEFRSLSQTLRKIGGGSGGSQSAGALGAAPPEGSTGSEFNRKASRIGLGIHEASQKIARLSKLAKKSSMFDDPTIEIQQLTALIKDDITAMNTALQDLQALQNLEMSDGRHSEDKAVHYTTVCDDLKGRLMGTTKQLQDVLTTRTQNIKAHENRKQMFSANSSRENQFRQQASHMNEPPPWSTPSNEPGNSQPTALASNGSQAGSQLRRRLGVETAPSHQMEVSMLQQVAPQQDTYAQSRATALHSVESTIQELGGIFTHLASMVAQQGEVAIRIDDNMEESLANVEGARSALLRHLNQISSNRRMLCMSLI